MSAAIDFPPVLGTADLARLLRKSRSTIYTDRVRSPHRLPPECTPPDCRQPLWLLTDALEWLAAHRQPVASPPAPVEAPAPRRRGRPTKAEQLARKRAQAAQGGAQ